MNARKLILSTLLLSFLVVSGCGGGGDFVDGVYTGPTAPAALTEESMRDFDIESFMAGQGAILPLGLSGEFLLGFLGGGLPLVAKAEAELQPTDLPEALVQAVRTRVLGSPMGLGKAEVGAAAIEPVLSETFDEVMNLSDYEGSGWVRIVGSATVVIDDSNPEAYRFSVAADVTLEFHATQFYYQDSEIFDGATRLVLSGTLVEPIGETMEGAAVQASLTCHAVDLHIVNPYFGFKTVESQEEVVEEIVTNGSYGISITASAGLEETRANLTVSTDMALLYQPSGEQTRLAATWNVGAVIPMAVEVAPSLVPAPKELPIPVSSLTLTSAGTLYSTRLGGSVRLSTTSAFDPEFGLFDLTTLAAWDGGALRLELEDVFGETSETWFEDFDGDGSFDLWESGIEGVWSYTYMFLPDILGGLIF